MELGMQAATAAIGRIAVGAEQAYHRSRLLQEDKEPRGQRAVLNEACARPLNRGSFWSPHTRLHCTGTGSDRPQAYIDCVTRRLGPRRFASVDCRLRRPRRFVATAALRSAVRASGIPLRGPSSTQVGRVEEGKPDRGSAPIYAKLLFLPTHEQEREPCTARSPFLRAAP